MDFFKYPPGVVGLMVSPSETGFCLFIIVVRLGFVGFSLCFFRGPTQGRPESKPEMPRKQSQLGIPEGGHRQEARCCSVLELL